jgi:hypothetical protein
MLKAQRRRLLLALALLLLLAAGCGQDQGAEPKSQTQQDTQDVGKPFCQQLTVPVKVRERTSTWHWDESEEQWHETWSDWEDAGEDVRPAGAEDCVKIINKVPTDAALPDLVMKQLDGCGKGELEASGGDCFFIVNPAPLDENFPELEGKKLLFFPIIVLNLGDGASELIADRTAEDAEDWRAYQTFYDAHGKRLGSMVQPNVEFYFAGDGHDHWHVRDFDDYYLLDENGQQVRVAEKHGYCMQDNTTYDPMKGMRNVPPDPGVYLDTTSCGKGLPNALTIIHGLSKGWGDTYPTTLPDQAIDITGVPDGTYRIWVGADSRDAVVELDEDNNSTSMEITITGDEVTTHPSTVRGGIP